MTERENSPKRTEIRITRGTPIRQIELDDYADAESHAYHLASKLNEVIDRLNAMNEVSR